VIYHITTKAEWTLAKAAGIYEPESLLADGYVHCVNSQLFEQVANFYYKNRADLIVLEIDEDKLKVEVRWEETGGPQAFPHIYGPIEVAAVVQTAALSANADGLFEFPFKPVLH